MSSTWLINDWAKLGKAFMLLGIAMLFIVGTSLAWFDNTASVRNNITIENPTSSSLANFPVWFTKDIGGFAKNCSDIMAVNSTDTEQIPFETESNTCSANNITGLWVMADSLAPNANVTFGRLYHNFTVSDSTGDKCNVWGTKYNGVYHLADKTTAQQNSACGYLNGTMEFGSTSTNFGVFGVAETTNGGANRFIINSGWSSTYENSENLTYTVFFKLHDTVAGILLSLYNGANQCGVYSGVSGLARLRIYCLDGSNNAIVDATSATGIYTADQWSYLSFRYDGHIIRVRTNGVDWLNTTGNNRKFDIATPANIYLGGATGYGGVANANADFDEFRILPYNMSDEYVKAVWDTRNGGTIGANEYLTTVPVVTILAPTNTTYSTLNRSLEVTSDQVITNYFYNLNGGANVAFTPNTTFLGINGANTIVVYGNNSNGIGNSSVRFTINTVPILVIDRPANVTYTASNVTIRINFTDSDPSQFWYILNGGANVTFKPNTTFIGAEGANVLSVYMNDTLNQMGSASVSFTVNTTAPAPVTPTTTTTDPNVLLFIVILAIVMIGLFWLIR